MKNDLRKHNVDEHNLLFECLFCNRKCTYKCLLVDHIRNVHHTKLNRNECEFSTHNENLLIKHKAFHNKSRGYKCKYCSFRIENKEKMLNHEHQHHTKSVRNSFWSLLILRKTFNKDQDQ